MNYKLIPVALVLLPTLATAGHEYERRQGPGHVAYARVIDARPIYEQVRIPEHREVCRSVPDHRGHTAEVVAPALLGAVLGGVIGNEIDGGSNRTAGTVAGALVGTAVGSSVGSHNAARHGGYRRQCQVREQYRYEERVVGYRVTYRYAGEIYHTRTDYDPGRRIRVRVDVRPG